MPRSTPISPGVVSRIAHEYELSEDEVLTGALRLVGRYRLNEGLIELSDDETLDVMLDDPDWPTKVQSQ